MDWFRVDSDVMRHPALFRLAAALGAPRACALGHLCAMWCGVAEHAEDGNLFGVEDAIIEDWAAWDGTRGAFVDALQTTGWIDSKRCLTGWSKRHEYMLAERKRKYEAYLQRRKSRASSAEVARDTRGSSARRAQPTSPHLTSPNHRKEEDGASAPSSPEHPKARELLEAWNALARELGLPTADHVEKDRTPHAKARLREGLLEAWPDFAAAMRGPIGEWHRRKKVGFDWLLRPGKARALIEQYRARPPTTTLFDPADAIPFDPFPTRGAAG